MCGALRAYGMAGWIEVERSGTTWNGPDDGSCRSRVCSIPICRVFMLLNRILSEVNVKMSRQP